MNNALADLRTAQNSMFPFVEKAITKAEENGKVEQLLQNREQLESLQTEVKQQLFNLLTIPGNKRTEWYTGIVDSGKRAIESLVSYFCPAVDERNVLVNTENYVAFNKFSAAQALKNQKDVEFKHPFCLRMGEALTINSAAELQKAKTILQDNLADTLWIAWNSTSTGVKEKVEELVAFRNDCGSSVVIICDAASLPLFSTAWKSIPAEHLPDVFFFSLRKQGIPYLGAQDEASQAKNSGALYIFNSRALELAKRVNGPSLYELPRPENMETSFISEGEQMKNHIRHLLKLQVCLDNFLSKNQEPLDELDSIRRNINSEIMHSFSGDGALGSQGFELLAESQAQSETTYVVRVPETFHPKDIIKELKEKGIHLSVSMHPKVPSDAFLRFASYPATSLHEAKTVLKNLQSYVA